MPPKSYGTMTIIERAAIIDSELSSESHLNELPLVDSHLPGIG